MTREHEGPEKRMRRKRGRVIRAGAEGRRHGLNGGTLKKYTGDDG